MKSIFALMVIMASFHGVHAQVAIGGQDGNGGDSCERGFKVIRDDIASWITRGGSAGLQLPAALTLEQYNMTMQVALRNARVRCTTNEIRVRRQPKTCRNFYEQGQPQIECNHQRFLQTPEGERHVLVHHEYAGLAGLEVTAASGASQYHLSNQLSGFLEDQVVKRLRVGQPQQSLTFLPDYTQIQYLPMGTVIKSRIEKIILPREYEILLKKDDRSECYLTSFDNFYSSHARSISGLLELTVTTYEGGNLQQVGWGVNMKLNGRNYPHNTQLQCAKTDHRIFQFSMLRELFSDPSIPNSLQIPLVAPFQ